MTMYNLKPRTKEEDPINYYWIDKLVDHYWDRIKQALAILACIFVLWVGIEF